MGQIKKEGTSWYFVAELGIDPLTGKRKRKKKRGFKTKKDAEKALAIIEAEVYKGVYFEPSTILFKDHLLEWFKIKRNSINFQTADTYQSFIVNRIVPSLGTIALSALSPLNLQSYVNTLKEEGLASSTVKKIYNIIKGALDYALNMELLHSNPIKKVQLPKDKKKEMSVWSVEEIKSFLTIAKKDRLYMAFHLAITTGMRRGEILGLRWKDIDFDRGILYVRQTLSKDGKQFLVGAKTESGVRSIKLPNETVSALLAQKKSICNDKQSLVNDYVDHDLVVCTSKGTPMNPNNLKRTYLKLIKEANVQEIRFHDLRHTHATMLLAQGISAKVISERLGHSNIKTTLDTYSHVLPNMQEEAANQIDTLLTATK
ncbi:tyrosine-type recombinase/integrase [Priestia koreensis]|uniref:tyrosine-type recombinase/integrase n=1 Tax=Priestia koreensis TaxID=284581 RepID=UPI001F5753B1|nr:site-specific integrase [Priestia koreensis]UNL85724.1 tyrosine-type recombinase/integrase [Priestia koreensis]